MPSENSNTAGGRTRENLVRVLNHALEEEVALSATLRDFLGHITGSGGYSLTRLLGDHCKQLDGWLGEIASRARAFGVVAKVGAAEVARATNAVVSSKPEDTDTLVPARSMVGEMLALHEGIAARLKSDLRASPVDAGISDLLTRLVEFHETTAWMLRLVQDGPEVPESAR